MAQLILKVTSCTTSLAKYLQILAMYLFQAQQMTN